WRAPNPNGGHRRRRASGPPGLTGASKPSALAPRGPRQARDWARGAGFEVALHARHPQHEVLTEGLRRGLHPLRSQGEARLDGPHRAARGEGVRLRQIEPGLGHGAPLAARPRPGLRAVIVLGAELAALQAAPQMVRDRLVSQETGERRSEELHGPGLVTWQREVRGDVFDAGG